MLNYQNYEIKNNKGNFLTLKKIKIKKCSNVQWGPIFTGFEVAPPLFFMKMVTVSISPK